MKKLPFLLMPGDTLTLTPGNLHFFISSDHPDPSFEFLRVEAVGPDWVVARPSGTGALYWNRPLVAVGDMVHEDLAKWCPRHMDLEGEGGTLVTIDDIPQCPFADKDCMWDDLDKKAESGG